jgi:hypothetical protein
MLRVMCPAWTDLDRRSSGEVTAASPWSGRELGRALAIFVITAVVLLAPWPRLGRAFSAAFTGVANVVVDALVVQDGVTARFSTPTAADRGRPEVGDWAVLLSLDVGRGARQTVLDTRLLGYTPLAVFLALVVATPVPRRRRLKILAGGGTILVARLAVAIALPVGRALGPRGPGWATGTFAEVIWWSFINPPAMSYVVAAFGWWLAVALTTGQTRAPSVKTGGGRRVSARTRASRRDRGRKTREVRASRPAPG